MYRALVKLTNGDSLDVVSGTKIIWRVLIDGGVQLLRIVGEFDEIGIPFKEVLFIRVYEMGKTV